MHRVLIMILAYLAMAGETPAATIPEPDNILYGQVCLPGGPASDQDDILVIARTEIGGQSRVVGQYKMGGEASASNCHGDDDCYVLRIRVETVPEGETPSGTAVVLTPQTPSTVDVFIKQGAEPEMLGASVAIDNRAEIRRLNLRGEPISTDINEDGFTTLADGALVQAALTGPVSQTAQPCDRTDINRDGHVDVKDFAYLQAEFAGTGQ